MSDFVSNYTACGNGFLVKLRSLTGEWVGLSRINPAEVQIVEKYDDYGFLYPDYIEVKNNKKAYFQGSDIIHMKKTTYKSRAWGLSCLPVILNCEILNGIKEYNYNQFKNGLLIDYFIIIEGGSLGDPQIKTVNGQEVLS